ncbi:MAG: hypothetical protein AAF282_20795 [Cyanobacteria bacterium P01_A01_bin.15]
MGVKFHPPKKSNQALWDVVSYLAKHGFYYQEIHNLNGHIWEPLNYPDNLTEAQHFVKHFCDQAIRPVANGPSNAEKSTGRAVEALP